MSGWVPSSFVTVGKPQPYPTGDAWVLCVVCAAQDPEWPCVVVWEQPGDFSASAGAIAHGTPVRLSGSRWYGGDRFWLYRVVGKDYATGRTISGWMMGEFLVLTRP